MASLTDDNECVLRARSVKLARTAESPPAAGITLELLEFQLASERYALETRHIREVQPLCDLTVLPGTPPFVLGIVNIRGRILPVLDLRKFFDLPEHGLNDLHRIILVQGNDLEFGLLADVIIGIRGVAADSLQQSLPTLAGVRADYLKGVSDQRLIVLDFERMILDPQIIVHQEIEN
jgi:purine-binding chemotaxis protein CheW